MRRDSHCSTPEGSARSVLKIVIASDVRFVRESLSALLCCDNAFTIVGESPDSDQLLNVCQKLRPDMVLLDAFVQDGLLAARQLREALPGLRIVVFAIKESVESVLVWAEAGVAGYIPSSAAGAELRALVANLGAGRQACSDLVAAGLLRRIAAAAAARQNPTIGAEALTPRELEIVRLISSGLSNKEIARQLNIGLATTKSHVHNALGKLNVQRRGQAATWVRTQAPAR
jgi:two-component system nitrate/nitrite response regulator NarL